MNSWIRNLPFFLMGFGLALLLDKKSSKKEMACGGIIVAVSILWIVAVALLG